MDGPNPALPLYGSCVEPTDVAAIGDGLGPQSGGQYNTQSGRSHSWWLKIVIVGLAGLLWAVCVTLAATFRTAQVQQTPLIVQDTLEESTVALESVEFRITNEYTSVGPAESLYPWLQGRLVEPYRLTTLTVENAVADTTYRWTVHSASGSSLLVGNEVVHKFTTVGEHTVTVTPVKRAGHQDGVVQQQGVTEVLVCKYVRREIRSLLPAEREEVLDAMSVLWKTDKEEGQELYGKEYVSIWQLNTLHHRAGSDEVCDHFHDGMAFLISHSAVTWLFEQSMQLVNPKLALPYWDVTVESSRVTADYGGDYQQIQEVSELFRSEWFGSSDPADNVVKDGRWAYTAIPAVLENQREYLRPNVYGLLRAPWDVSGAPYLSRGFNNLCGEPMIEDYQWPTCASHYDLLASSPSLYSWTWNAQYVPHGPVHAFIGGVNDCTDMYEEMAALVNDSSITDTLRKYSWMYRKCGYRSQLWGCQGQAEAGQSPQQVMDSGACGCATTDFDSEEDVAALLEGVQFYVADLTAGLSWKQRQGVARLLCTGAMSMGDNLQSSAGLDPMFWPIHGTMERLYQYALLSGAVPDTSWPTESYSYTDDSGQSYSVELSMWNETCIGHFPTDVFPYGLIDPQDLATKFNLWNSGLKRNTYTNAELVKALDPTEDALPYVYDNYEWPHCLAEGVDFTELPSKMGSRLTRAAYKVFEAHVETGSAYPRFASMLKARDSVSRP